MLRPTLTEFRAGNQGLFVTIWIMIDLSRVSSITVGIGYRYTHTSYMQAKLSEKHYLTLFKNVSN